MPKAFRIWQRHFSVTAHSSFADLVKEPESGRQSVLACRVLDQIRHGCSAGSALNVALVKALGETPALVARLRPEREEKGCRIILYDGVKEIHLYLSKIVKAVIENLRELAEKARQRSSFGRQFV